jgi:hypothetical protein
MTLPYQCPISVAVKQAGDEQAAIQLLHASVAGLDTSTWTWSSEEGLQAGSTTAAARVPSLQELQRLRLDSEDDPSRVGVCRATKSAVEECLCRRDRQLHMLPFLPFTAWHHEPPHMPVCYATMHLSCHKEAHHIVAILLRHDGTVSAQTDTMHGWSCVNPCR